MRKYDCHFYDHCLSIAARWNDLTMCKACICYKKQPLKIPEYEFNGISGLIEAVHCYRGYPVFRVQTEPEE